MTDPFAHDDGAYVLGALSDDDRRLFEAHLETCVDCRARVAQVRDVPALLAGVDVADLADESIPDTLLPGLLRRGARRGHRRRWVVAGLGAVAAACLVTLAVLVWPFGSSGGGSAPQARSFVPVVAGAPVRADGALIAKAWGTEVDLHCSYADGVARPYPYPYALRVVAASGATDDLGSWTVPVGKDITYTAGTRLRIDQISKVQIVTTNGTPVLELDN